MKKREVLLDFTSLLDVILILLFIVITNMNNVSVAANKASERAFSEAQAQIDAISGEREALKSQLEGAKAAEAELKELDAELQKLQQEHAALVDDHDYLKIISDYDEKDISVYKAALERMTKVMLLCGTGFNTATGHYEVKVDIYLDKSNTGEQSFVDSFTIVHDFSLTKEQRDRYKADQVVEVTKQMSGALRDQENKMVWITIQHAYDDENFTNMDMEILYEAIHNLERIFSISCYAEEIKLY